MNFLLNCLHKCKQLCHGASPKKNLHTWWQCTYIAFLLPLQRKKGKSYVLDDNFMMCKLGDGAMCELHDDAMVVLHLKRWWTNSANQGV
jgi:hypothetical protein